MMRNRTSRYMLYLFFYEKISQDEVTLFQGAHITMGKFFFKSLFYEVSKSSISSRMKP